MAVSTSVRGVTADDTGRPRRSLLLSVALAGCVAAGAVSAITSGIYGFLLLVMLPMFGDYYTNNLLSGSPRTNMVGNLIDNSVNSPLVTQAASMVVILMVLLLLPMLYYLYATNRATREDAG